MSGSLVHRIYYALKPMMPRRLRYAVRSAVARYKLPRVSDIWPIMPGSERPPKNWPGWPGEKQFAIILTHDVEGQLGIDRCRQLAGLEMELGFRSSFNFVPEGDYTLSSDLHRWLVANGFEVGVHDHKHDGKLYRSRADFNAGAKVINRHLREWNAVGFRAGFMFHNLNWIHDLNVLYDASTFDTDPFEPQPSGVGTIFPFWVTPPAGGRGYAELPYTLVQDSTLFLFLRERSIRLWKQKLDWVAKHGGMVLVNTHPDYIGFEARRERFGEYPSAYYAELLKYIQEEYQGRYWHARPCEIAKWVSSTLAPSTEAAWERQPEINTSPETPLVMQGRRAASVLFSDYPGDPRPRRAAEALHRAGMIVDVLCICEDGQPKGWDVVNGVNVCRLAIRRHRQGKVRYLLQYSGFLARATWFLASRSLRRRYDIVHVHNMPDFLVFCAVVPKLLGARVILDLHDPMPELFQSLHSLAPEHWALKLLRRIEKWSIGFANMAVTPNIAFRELFAARSCKSCKIEVIMNSPDEEFFHSGVQPLDEMAPRSGDRPFRILFHGSLVHRHGLDTAAEALIEVQRDIPDAQLLICGSPTPYLDSILDSAKKNGLADRVLYLGFKAEHEIARIIAASDVGVIPNRRSPFTEINMPTRIFEFLAVGKPVIAPSTRGIKDYFAEEELLFFEPGDPKDLARQVVWVYRCPNEAVRTVKRGREVYQRNMWRPNRQRFLSLVSSLLK